MARMRIVSRIALIAAFIAATMASSLLTSVGPDPSGRASGHSIEAMASAQAVPRDASVQPYRPLDSLSPKTDPAYVPGELIIKFKADPTDAIRQSQTNTDLPSQRDILPWIDSANPPKAIERVFPDSTSALQHSELSQTDDLSGVYKLTFESDADILHLAQLYSDDPKVVYAEPNYIARVDGTPDDTHYAQQWALAKINAPAAWDVQTGNPGVVIAVIDTGVDLNHPDLDERVWSNPGEASDGLDNDGNGLVDDNRGWDFVNQDAIPQDDNGHGTHVAGIAAAETNNSQGVAGLCWNCRIMPIKAFQSSGRGSYSDIAAAIQYAANKGAQVINMSFGGTVDSQLMRDALESAYGTSVLVASAGNDNSSLPRYPAAYPWVVSVAATDSADKKAAFSNYGAWVSVSAPGVDIYSTLLDDTYAGWSGTSMAAPYVSGLAALIIAQHPTWSKELVRGQITKSTDGIDATNPLYAGKLGSGRINAQTAMSLTPAPDVRLQTYAVGDGTGDRDGKADAGEEITLTATLQNYWGDAANVSATLSTSDPNATIIGGTSSYGNISPYATLDNQSNPFRLTISGSTPNNHDITLRLDISVGGVHHGTANFFLTVQRGTEVGGLISSDTTWTADKEYLVTSSVIVTAGITLTIQPGTIIRFNPSTFLAAKGSLRAIGTPSQPIRFTSNSVEAPGSWYGIQLAGDKSYLRYAVVEYAGQHGLPLSAPLDLLGSSPHEVTNNLFQSNRGMAGTVSCVGPSTFRQNAIYDTNTSYENTGLAIGLGCDAQYNNIIGNYNDIQALYRATVMTRGGTPAPTFRNNTLYDGNPLDFSLYLGNQTIDISLNYWGTTDSTNIAQRIHDFYDDPNLGIATFAPVLTQPDPMAPPIAQNAAVETGHSRLMSVPMAVVGNETMTITVDFSAPMDTSITPIVTFGVIDPFTQHQVKTGQWVSPSRWVGKYQVDVTTGDGLNTLRIADARSADGFFAIPVDKRFQFTIQTAGTEAMLLQAAAGFGKVSLSWPQSDIPALAGYNVYRSAVTNTQFVTTTPLNPVLLTTPSYTDTSVTNGTTYYYRYTVVDTGLSESGYSNEASATPNDPTPPTAPLVFDDGTCTPNANSFHAHWSAIDPESGIAEYQYGIGTSPGLVNVVNWTLVGTASQVTKTGLNLTPGVPYYISVKAKNGAGQWSAAGCSDGIVVDATCKSQFTAYLPLVVRGP